VIFLFLFLPWRAKTATHAKLWGPFCSFFLRGQNHNFVKVKGLKLQLRQIKNVVKGFMVCVVCNYNQKIKRHTKNVVICSKGNDTGNKK